MARREALQRRSHLRNEIIHRELESNSIRIEPLGLDRRYNRYWHFVNTATGASTGRVFIESQENGGLRVICTVEAYDALVKALDKRGPREKGLLDSLVLYRPAIVAAMPTAPLSVAMAREGTNSSTHTCLDAEALVKSLQLAASTAPGQGVAGMDVDVDGKEVRHKDEKIACLKAALLAIEGSIPEERLSADDFDAKLWRSAVHTATDIRAVRRCLGQLEAGISSDALHIDYSRDPLLVKGAWIPVGEEVATAMPGSTITEIVLPSSPPPPSHQLQQTTLGGEEEEEEESEEPLKWLPPTAAAVGLRLALLDASLKYKGSSVPTLRDTLTPYHRVVRPFSSSLGIHTAIDTGSSDGSSDQQNIVYGPVMERQGRTLPVLFPPFPYRLLLGPRIDFSFDVESFKKQVDVGAEEVVLAVPGTGLGALSHLQYHMHHQKGKLPSGGGGAGGGGVGAVAGVGGNGAKKQPISSTILYRRGNGGLVMLQTAGVPTTLPPPAPPAPGIEGRGNGNRTTRVKGPPVSQHQRRLPRGDEEDKHYGSEFEDEDGDGRDGSGSGDEFSNGGVVVEPAVRKKYTGGGGRGKKKKEKGEERAIATAKAKGKAKAKAVVKNKVKTSAKVAPKGRRLILGDSSSGSGSGSGSSSEDEKDALDSDDEEEKKKREEDDEYRPEEEEDEDVEEEDLEEEEVEEGRRRRRRSYSRRGGGSTESEEEEEEYVDSDDDSE